MNNVDYIRIPINILKDPNLNDGEKLLLSLLIFMSNGVNNCYPSNDYLAKFLNVSKKTISVRINSLKNKGYILVNLEIEEKQIIKRYIKIMKKYFDKSKNTKSKPMEEIVNTYGRILPEGMEENVNTPMEENVKDKKKSIKNNIENIYIDKFEIFRKEYSTICKRVKGNKVELDNLIKKHKNYLDIINYLYDNRDELIKYMKSTYSEPKYTPGLNVFINNSIWEHYETNKEAELYAEEKKIQERKEYIRKHNEDVIKDYRTDEEIERAMLEKKKKSVFLNEIGAV